jgi:hypothetical protein
VTPPAAAAAAAAPATRGRSTAPVRPRVAPPRPRRVSGPVRPPAKRSSGAQTEHGLVPSLLGALDGVSRSGALDRLIRGRIWIGVITFALIGIVTLQLLVLQLNASIGRSLVREAQLQRANAALSIEGSELAGGERVETQAALLGMQIVPEGSLRFLTDNPRANVARAAAAVKARVHAASNTAEDAATTPAASAPPSSEASGVASEPAPTGEAANAAATSTSATGESDPSATTPDTPASEPVSPGTSTAPPAATTTPGEAPVPAAVAQAGGVGAGQPNGGG